MPECDMQRDHAEKLARHDERIESLDRKYVSIKMDLVKIEELIEGTSKDSGLKTEIALIRQTLQIVQASVDALAAKIEARRTTTTGLVIAIMMVAVGLFANVLRDGFGALMGW